MSEVEKHYGADADDLDRPKAATRSRAAGDLRGGTSQTARQEQETSVVERAEGALDDAKERATRAAGRMRKEASERYDRAQDWAQDSYESLSRNAVYARRRSVAELNRGRRNIAAFVDENPIMVGVAGLAAGLLIGALLPRTRREDELLGPYADDVRREGMRYAKEAAEQGREAIKENIRSVTQPVDRDPTP